MRKSDVFESKYLRSADIPEATFVPVRIDRVEVLNMAMEGKPPENRPVIFFQGKQKGMVLNAGNWDILEAAYGDSDDWNGKPASLYITPTHTPAGQPCMGLRLSIPKAKPAAQQLKQKPTLAPAPVVEYQGEADTASAGPGTPNDDIPFAPNKY